MHGIDAVARILKQEGVEYLFAYPNNPLIDAAAAIGIRPVIARSEKTLINMADGYCRATNGRRPRDVGVAEIDEAGARYAPPRRFRSAPDPDDVAEAVRLLLGARRPVLHAGHGVLWAEAWDELRELAETAQIPVMTTMAAKSAFP